MRRAFLYISLPFLHDYDVTKENVNKQRRNFISLSELEYGSLEFKFRRVCADLTK